MNNRSITTLLIVLQHNDKSLRKAFASSLTRSLFTGKIMVLSPALSDPLFRIERANVSEKLFSGSTQGVMGDLLRAIATHQEIDCNEWLIMVSAPGIALRNIDHLIPSNIESFNPASSVDLYWLAAVGDSREISSHFWAVRAKHLPMLLERWESMWSSKDENHYNESLMWSEMIKSLPLKKKPFEKGEIYCPEVGAVDWDAITKAAIIMVPNWPEKMQWSFLQSLYFGTYFGDETGLMLNLLDA
jgi:hypothetical protein